MAKHFDIPLYHPKPTPGMDAPGEQAAPVILDSLASLAADRRVPEPSVAMRLLILAAAIIGLLAAGCAPERPPLPGAELPAQLDRIQLGIVSHELALCRAGLGRHAR